MIMTPLYTLGSSPTKKAPQKWGALLCLFELKDGEYHC